MYMSCIMEGELWLYQVGFIQIKMGQHCVNPDQTVNCLSTLQQYL